jgi:HEAT repeat protein
MKAAGALIGILWLLGAQSGGDAKSLGKVLIEGGTADRRRAAGELERMGSRGAEALPYLMRAYRYDFDLEVRRGAARALATIDPSNPKILSALRDGLVDEKSPIRIASANALALAGGLAWTTVDALLRRGAKDKDPLVRDAAFTAIVAIAKQREDAIWQVIERLSSDDTRLQIAACSALERTGNAARVAIPFLRHMRDEAQGKRPDLLDASVRALGEIEGTKPTKKPTGNKYKPTDKTLDVTPAMEELMRLMTSDTAGVRRTAVEEVAKLREQALPAVMRLGKLVAEDEDPEVSAAAARALGEIGPPAARALLALRTALTDGSLEVRRASAVAIGKIGPGAVGAIGDLARAWTTDVDAGMRADAAASLRRLQVSKADVASALGEDLHSEDPGVRLRACYAIAELGSTGKDNDAVAALEGALADEVAAVRAAAAFSLGSLGIRLDTSLQALAHAMADGEESVRKNAGDALKRIDPPTYQLALAAVAESRPAEGAASKPAAEPNVAAESKPTYRDPAALAAAVADLLRGEGGATNPSSKIENGKVRLLLKLAHPRFDETDAHRDAVWLSLKLLGELPELGSIDVSIVHNSGRVITTSTVTLERARTYFERLEDSFERRRLQDWWGPLTDR